MTASCTVTLTNPVPGPVTERYEFNKSPHPTIAASVTFQTCASGTCSEYDNTTYYQLSNTYKANPLTPSTWDGAYLVNVYGTFLGVAGTASTSCGATTENGGLFNCGARFFDYNTATTVGSTHGATLIGNTWVGQSDSITSTTDGNTYTVNFVQFTAAPAQPVPTWLALLFVPGLILGVIIRRRR